MNKATDMGTKHSGCDKVNLYWIIGILLFLLVVSVTFNIFDFCQPKGNDSTTCDSEGEHLLVDLISFASTLASLLLALIAIFYSIKSNTEGMRQWGQIDSAVTDIRAINKSIQKSEQKMADSVREISTKLGAIDANTRANLRNQMLSTHELNEIKVPPTNSNVQTGTDRVPPQQEQ